MRENADALGESLVAGGLDVITGGTDTHLLLVDLRATEWTGADAEDRLHEVGVTVNKNAIPFDERPPAVASGLRVGTPACTMRGFDAEDFREVGRIICDALAARRRRPGAARPLAGALRPEPALPGLPRLLQLRVGATASLCHVDHPLVEHKLSLLRERSTSTADFRRVVNELTALLTYEATKDFPTEEVEIETPLERTTVRRISGKKVAVVPVLRAGLGMLDGVLSLVSGARVGFVGLYRDEETLQPVEYYLKLPADLAAPRRHRARPDARDRQLRRAARSPPTKEAGAPLGHARLPRRGARGDRAARRASTPDVRDLLRRRRPRH